MNWFIVGIGVSGALMLVCLFMLVRNIYIHEASKKAILLVYEMAKKDIIASRGDWERWNEIYGRNRSYSEMMLRVWVWNFDKLFPELTKALKESQ